MYIVPYTYSCSKHPIGILVFHTIDLLVQGACTSTLWEEEGGQSVEDILTSNDIYCMALDMSGSTTYAKVDTKRTDMGSMFKASELPMGDKDTLCWRRFNYITQSNSSNSSNSNNSSNSSNSSNSPWLPSPFGTILDGIVKREATLTRSYANEKLR